MTVLTLSAPSSADILSASSAAPGADLVVCLTHRVASTPSLGRLANALAATGKPLVTVALRDPYDVAHHDSAAALCTYSYSPVVPAALVR